MEEIKEKIGIFILNYNGLIWLKESIPNIIKYSPNNDIILIDNQSSDGSVNFIKKKFPQIKIKINNHNYGFSKGYNEVLLNETKYDYFIIMNNDVQVTPNWIQPLLKTIKQEGTNIVQPKIKNIKIEHTKENNQEKYIKTNKFDYAGGSGGFLDIMGIPFCRGRIINTIEEDIGQYDQTQRVFWASGCCFMINKNTFQDLNGFDNDFFMHHEEIDLCWRAQKNNQKIFCCPESVVFHFGGGTMQYNNPLKHYYNHRNSLLLLVKNMCFKRLLATLIPRILLDYIIVLFYLLKASFLLMKKGDFKLLQAPLFIFMAHMSFLLLLPKFLYKRKPIKMTFLYPKSILIEYFFRNKKKFSDLKKF
ncbi:MAG: dTDP-Rha--alpha-D-GlcNAc-pyrophosphate polyprenol alpha-3-L-rhamnosyltransferase [Flavobacteriales bacterium]|nr:dTDP-Rha--alpha-D-GlcNAc-pyrophosphate polyprenol alpha-3-L-rhamnosyltransferase [Flavobacteriales bacterium]|tara:strand:- start:805 stop:1887 length:1083 start_codon:yes stop_codon:yes gene_type:complete